MDIVCGILIHLRGKLEFVYSTLHTRKRKGWDASLASLEGMGLATSV